MTTNVSREQAFSVLATNFSISPSSSGYTLQVSADGVNYSDLFAVGANVTRMVTGVASGSFYKLRGNTDTNVIVNWERQCNDGQGGGGGSEYILPAATQSTLGGVKVGAGLSVTPDGTLSSEGGSGEGVVYVTHLSDAEAVAAPVGTLVVVNDDNNNIHSIYIKVEGGEVAYWNGYNNNQGTEPFQIIYDDYDDFVNFADGKSIISFKYIYGGEYRHIVVDKEAGALILYENDLVTEVARASYLGNEVRFPASQQSSLRGIYVHWKEDEISFRLMEYTQAAEILSFATEGIHYHRVTDPTKATAQDLGLGTGYGSGIPEWNNEGVIVRKYMNVSATGLQFNTNASEYSSTGKITILTDGTNNGPKRIFAPTDGGTAGQILVSNGDNAAPTFQNWIKAQQITSADYEALAVKDPNVLYLIVDE